MTLVLQPHDYEARARRHRECAKLSRTPDLVRFHDDLAVRLDRLAETSRELLQPWLSFGEASGARRE